MFRPVLVVCFPNFYWLRDLKAFGRWFWWTQGRTTTFCRKGFSLKVQNYQNCLLSFHPMTYDSFMIHPFSSHLKIQFFIISAEGFVWPALWRVSSTTWRKGCTAAGFWCTTGRSKEAPSTRTFRGVWFGSVIFSIRMMKTKKQNPNFNSDPVGMSTNGSRTSSTLATCNSASLAREMWLFHMAILWSRCSTVPILSNSSNNMYTLHLHTLTLPYSKEVRMQLYCLTLFPDDFWVFGEISWSFDLKVLRSRSIGGLQSASWLAPGRLAAGH